MRWRRLALWMLAATCAAGTIAAQEPSNSPLFRQWISGQNKFAIVNGRVVSTNGGWMFGMPRQVATEGPIREQITFGGNGLSGSLTYLYQSGGDQAAKPSDPKVEFVLEINSDGRFVFRYTDKDHPLRYFHLTQVPGQPLSLSLPPSDKPRVLQAPTLWHLLIIDAEDCRKQFLPMLEGIRSNWNLGLTAQAAEDELVKMAAVSRKSDRKEWDAWIKQLGDPQLWTRRERAERNLRDVGPPLLGYLNRLDMSRLDAEQKSRLRRIIRDLSAQSGEDTPQHVASMLIEDPLVWLALLSRPEESTREAAVQQLSVLLNVPITVDPKASPESQAKARDALRKQIEKTGGERK